MVINMRKVISLILILSLLFSALLLTGCSASEECEYESFKTALSDIRDAVPDEDMEKEEAEKINNVTACVYGDDEEYYDVRVTDELVSLFDGEFTKADGFEGKKVLSVTVSMQYEITFFDSGDAMIYYGFCGVFQSDRQYYKFTLNGGIDALREYILTNGTKLNMEDK